MTSTCPIIFFRIASFLSTDFSVTPVSRVIRDMCLDKKGALSKFIQHVKLYEIRANIGQGQYNLWQRKKSITKLFS